MNASEFEQFLTYADKLLTGSSDLEKITRFIAWCKDKEIEEVILRLSSEGKQWWQKSFFLDFTTTRIIVSKKKFARKFVDAGFIAGMAPFPYMVISKNLKMSNIRKGSLLKPDEILKKDSSNYYIRYSEIQEFFLRKGVETMIRNMLGSAIRSNFLTIKTINNNTYEYSLPVSKNGSFEKIHYWLSVILPNSVLTG